MLGLYERPLLIHSVWAWRYGPVVQEVYHNLKRYGGDPIPEPIPNIGHAGLDEEQNNIVRQVYEKYGKLDGIILSQLTHAAGTPWHHIWNASGQNAVIPDSLIQQHYRGIYLRERTA